MHTCVGQMCVLSTFQKVIVANLKLLMTQVLGFINSTLNASQAIEDVASFESTLASVCALQCISSSF